MFDFAKSSIDKLNEMHPDLRLIFESAKKVSEIDFDISCGHRPVKVQQELFKVGRSQLDGINKKSRHNYIPAKAGDAYCYNGSKASYTIHQMSYLAGVMKAVSEQLYESGQIQHKIRWGGNWNMDGEIITDQEFDDLPHFEIIKP